MKERINLRLAKEADALQIATLHIKAWRHTYKDIIHQDYLDNRLDLVESTERWYKNLNSKDKATFLALEYNALAGFATVGHSRDERFSEYAELYAIYLEPDYLYQGIGRCLVQHVKEHAYNNGYKKMFASVLIANITACNFYQQVGATLMENVEKEIIIDKQAYPEMTFEWKELP